MLFAFDASFTKQQRCGARKFSKVYINHHVQDRMNTLGIQIAMAVVPKLKRTIICWRLYQIGRFHFVHLHKNDFV